MADHDEDDATMADATTMGGRLAVIQTAATRAELIAKAAKEGVERLERRFDKHEEANTAQHAEGQTLIRETAKELRDDQKAQREHFDLKLEAMRRLFSSTRTWIIGGLGTLLLTLLGILARLIVG